MEEFDNDLNILDSIPNKRNQKLIRKFDQDDIDKKKDLISNLINNWEFDKSNFNISQRQKEDKGKRHHKKTIEEIGLLEYFLSQDPEWSK
jgi:hypothetical protein